MGLITNSGTTNAASQSYNTSLARPAATVFKSHCTNACIKAVTEYQVFPEAIITLIMYNLQSSNINKNIFVNSI